MPINSGGKVDTSCGDCSDSQTGETALSTVRSAQGARSVRSFSTVEDLVDNFDGRNLSEGGRALAREICSVLGCDQSEIHDVFPLKKGLTNLSCHFATSSGEYVYRHPGIGTEAIIDRSAELQAQIVAKELGLDDTFIFGHEQQGWKISRYLPDCTLLDPHDETQLKRAMGMARSLHEQGGTVCRTFDFFEEGARYEALLLEKGPITVPGYWDLAHAARQVKKRFDADGARVCLCHNDFFDGNLLVDRSGKLYLIDWECAGMSDYANDYGTFVVTCKLSDDEAASALAHYFGRTPTPSEVGHHIAAVALAAWCWYVWALYKEREGDCTGEWRDVYHRYAQTYLSRALARTA